MQQHRHWVHVHLARLQCVPRSAGSCTTTCLQLWHILVALEGAELGLDLTLVHCVWGWSWLSDKQAGWLEH